MRTRALIAATALAVSVARPAAADDAHVRAQQLFESGLADAMAGRYADACPKFVASQAADPKTSTLLNLGRCYESLGRIASAWATMREAEALARKSGRADLEGTARASAESLAPRLVFLTVAVPQASRVPGLVVSRDGKKIDEAEWNVAIPADAGDHEITAEAPDHDSWRKSVTLETTNRAIDVPALAARPVSTTTRPPPAPVELWTPLRIGGAIAGGTGVAALGAGLVVAFIAKSNYDDARAQCGAPDDCPAGAVRDSESARSLATVGTVTMIAGGVIAAAGGVVVLLAPRWQTQVGLGSVGLVRTW